MIRPVIDFFSDPLRLTLLIAGILVLLLIYLFSRRPKISKTARAPENVSVHPSAYADLPEERAGVGKVVVKKREELEQVNKSDRENKKSALLPEGSKKPVEQQKAAPVPPILRKDKVEAATEKVVDEAVVVDEPEVTPVPTPGLAGEATSAPKPEPVTKPAKKPIKLNAQPKKIIAIHLKADSDRLYTGRLFINALLEAGLELGEQNIFHFIAKDQAEEYVAFSVANMHEPGTFDMDAVDDFQTDGISFFMQVPLKIGNASLAYTQMMSTAQRLARRLGGQLLTEKRQPLTVPEINALRVEVEKYM